MRSSIRAALIAIAAVAAVAAVLPASAPAAKRYRVDVVRDSSGIPHIKGRDFRSLGYGAGFAYAQDNACLFAEAVVTLRGERTRFFGADGEAVQFANGAADPNPKSDAFWKWVGATKAPARLGRELGKQPTALYRGWVAGFNRYLRSGKLEDPACKGKAYVRRVTFDDLLRRGLQIETNASSGRFLSGLFDAQPPTARRSARSAARLDSAALRAATGAEAGDSQLGSNGLAFGSSATRGGNGLLLTNPHFPWRGVDRFWMAHLTVPGSYDVMGGTLGGFPAIGVGFNEDLAWTHTVSTGRRFVAMQLKLAPGDPTSYLVDGRAVPMTRTTVTVAGRPHTFYGTRYGLVVNVDQAGYTWTDDTAYALLDANLDNTRVVRQYLDMGRAKNVRELLMVEARTRGIPFFNTIAADRRGDALYTDMGRYSNVPESLIDACLPAGGPQLVFAAARVVTLDGSRSACVPKGNLPASAQPRLIRKDYVLNSNDSFWLANPKAPITGITPLIGLADTVQGVRTRSGNRMVQTALAKGRRFGVKSLQELWQNNRNHLAELMSKDLAALCRANPTAITAEGVAVDISAACAVLESYDQTGNLDSDGAWLFAAYTRRSPSGADFWADAVDLRDPIRTPNRLNTANPGHLQALAAAVKELRDAGVPLDSGLRGVQVARRKGAKISIHGCPNCFQNVNASDGDDVAGAPYGEVVQGSSMVLSTQLTKQGPRAEGILTYSQATDRTSPYFADQTRLFSAKRWVPMRFSAKALRADRGRQRVRVPGARRLKRK